MIGTNRVNQFILGDKFTTKPVESTPVGTDISIFFDPKKLFKEGITEKEFIDSYQDLMSSSIFNNGNNETGNLYSSSPISDEELDEMEQAAKKYFEAIDKDKNGVLTEEEIGSLALRDGTGEDISDEDILSLTKELFPDETTKAAPLAETQKNKVKRSNSGGGSGGSYNPVNNNTNTQSSGTKAQTLDELKEQRNQKQTELDTARSDLKTVYSEGNQNVKN